MQITSSYIYIPVSNLELAAKWYEEHLEFNVVKVDPIFLELRTESRVRVMLIPNEKNIMSHMNYANGPQATYGFTVSDIMSAYNYLVSKGIRVRKISNYDGTSFGFQDLDGNIIELWSDSPLSC